MLSESAHQAERRGNTSLGRRRQQRQAIALHEWLILTLFLLILTIVLSVFNGLQRLDQTAYDLLLRNQSTPARDDIIIVAIDDFSLAELGKWPWPRARHADLIQRLNAAKPRAIGVDIVFAEAETTSPDNPNGDQLLAQALTASQRVVLPLVSINAGRGLQAVQATPILAQAATMMGHIHLELDEDGVARSVFLKEGTQGLWWPHFSLALYEIGRKNDREANLSENTKSTENAKGTKTITQIKTSDLPVNTRQTNSSNTAAGIWHRNFQLHIPYYGSSGHFTSVPYVAVLRGEVPTEFFRDKYVLIGTTAHGMADAFPTPVTSNQGVLSGIEINANILASLLDGRSIIKAQAWQVIVISVLVLGLAWLGFAQLSIFLTKNCVFYGTQFDSGNDFCQCDPHPLGLLASPCGQCIDVDYCLSTMELASARSDY